MQEGKDIAMLLRGWMEAYTSRSMHDMWRFARKTGLSMPQYGLLRRLYHGGECEVHEVGRHFDVTSARASQLVDRMVQAGLVARTENPEDRRVRTVALTAKGRALVEKCVEESYRWVDDLAVGLDARTRTLLKELTPLLMKAEEAMPRPEKHAALSAIRGAR